MKKLINVYILAMVASLISFAPANAEDCSPQNPCMTYAEVDANGNVVNAIVCQPSVCDSMWGGKNPNNGNKLVPQLAADSNGNNRGGYNSGPEVSVTESQGTFTIADSRDNSVKTIQKPDVQTDVSATTNPITKADGTVSQKATVNAYKNDVSVEKTFEEQVTEEQFEISMKSPFDWDFSQLNLIFSAFDIWLKMLEDWFLNQ